MKYDDPLENDENEVHNMLFHYITPGAKVLEFGAASGRVTKILKERYNCKVFIVEFNEEDYNHAIKYAEQGFCGDLESYEWLDMWNDERFDFVMFTDVLEHLKDGHKALTETTKILKSDGSVLISIPSIGHNDIFIKLLKGDFDYTDIGLLDDTHLHLYTEKTLKNLVDGTGYIIDKIKYKTIKTGSTEQFREIEPTLTPEFERMLLNRQNGEVYQFVMVLKKKDAEHQHNCEMGVTGNYMAPHGWLYIDYGEGFNQKDCQYVEGIRIEENTFRYSIDMEIDDSHKAIRFDPFENQICEVIKIDSNIPEYILDEKRIIDGHTIWLSGDPYIKWELEQKEVNHLSFDIVIKIFSSVEQVELIESLGHFLCKVESDLEKALTENDDNQVDDNQNNVDQ